MSGADFVVQVNLVHGEEEPLSTLGDPFYVCWAEVLANAEEALEKFESRASAALPGSAVQRLVYQDDEGDWCTLNKHSLTDAQGFMAISEDGACMSLRIKVVANAAGALGEREMTQVPLADAESASKDPSAPSAAAAEAVTEAADLLQAVNQIACGLDLRRLVPRLAAAGLRVVESAAEPALFPLIESLEAFREGELSADSLPVALPEFAQALADLPPGNVPGVLELCKKEAARAVEELKQEAGEGLEVEVHRNVICDGCEVTPIMGKRYRSLTKGDYDLCEACFSKTDEDKNSFKRVKSDVVAQVVSSFYGPRGSSGGALVHHSVQCDGCGEFPLVGTRFRSLDRPDYDLCGRCHGELQASGREAGRPFQEIAPPGHRPPNREDGEKGEMDLVVEGAGLAAFAAAEVNATAEPEHHGKGKHKGMCKGKGKGKHKGKHHDRPPPPPTAPATSRPERGEEEESWKLFFDKDAGEYYYHNRMTKETTWSMPETLRQTSLAQQVSGSPAPDEPCEKATPEIEESLRALDEHALRGVLAGLLAHPDRSVRDAAEAAASSPARRDGREPEGSCRQAQDDDNMETSHEVCSVHSWEMPDVEPSPPEPIELLGPSAEPESGLPAASARVLGSAPLTLGVEAQEVHSSRGDATEELAAAGAAQAYRIGCVVLPSGLGAAVPVCAKVAVVNDGQVPWPETTAVALVAGEALGFQHLPLGPLEPGEAAEVVMDLLVPPKPAPCAQRSSWAVVDTSNGSLLGPILVLEVQWGGA